MRLDLLPVLISPALTITMLGAIESLLSATVADRMGGDRHNPNVELFGQGIANIFSPLFGGLPATGAIARTATSIRSGAKTPVAGIIHALTILAVLLWAAPLARHIPLAVLASILVVVAYNMGEWATDSRSAEAHQVRYHHLAGDVRADRVRRSHRCRRSGNDSGSAGVHSQSHQYDHGFARDRRVHQQRPRPCFAGQAHPRLRGGVSHPRAISVRRDGQGSRHHSKNRLAAAKWFCCVCAT